MIIFLIISMEKVIYGESNMSNSRRHKRETWRAEKGRLFHQFYIAYLSFILGARLSLWVGPARIWRLVQGVPRLCPKIAGIAGMGLDSCLEE